MIIAVTGSNGAIAKKLIPFLENCGHEIIKISTSLTPNSQSTFSYREFQSQNILKKVDLFIHLASFNSNLKKDSMEEEVDLTRIVLDSMPAMHCSKLIFFSSCKVYGDNDTTLVSYDETHPANPVCIYGKAKLECESLIADQANSNLSSIIFRLPPVLNESNGSNLAKLMMFARKKNPILSFAEGETNQRSFISFNNIELVMKYILDNPSFIQDSQVFNLADDSSISLHDLLRALSGKDIYIAPKMISRLVFRAPFLKHFLLKLYGNFVIDNSKLQNEMDVKLASTRQLLANGETI